MEYTMIVECVNCEKSESKLVSSLDPTREMEEDGWKYEDGNGDWYCEDCYQQELDRVERYYGRGL